MTSEAAGGWRREMQDHRETIQRERDRLRVYEDLVDGIEELLKGAHPEHAPEHMTLAEINEMNGRQK
jgi:hypothetical protein